MFCSCTVFRLTLQFLCDVPWAFENALITLCSQYVVQGTGDFCMAYCKWKMSLCWYNFPML